MTERDPLAWVPSPPPGEPPPVDRMYTRALEHKQVVRTTVRSAILEEVRPNGAVLRTRDVASTRMARFEPSSDLPTDGKESRGTLRVEIVGDGVVRVRYAPGDEVPVNETPMLVGTPDGVEVEVESGERAVVLRAGATTVEVTLGPVAISVRDGDREVAFVGGREKNFWNLWDASNTGVSRTEHGEPLATETFALRPGECVYGFGEQFTRLDKVGQTVDLNMVEATGTSTPRAYKNVPLFVTTHGYGVFVHSSARMTCWVGSIAASDVQLAVEDDFLDYFVLVGDIKTVLARHTDLTGKPAVPPRWSFGFWQSKISYRSAEECLDVVRRLRAARLPMDVLHIDTHWFREDWRCDLEFDSERFRDPAALMSELATLGVKVSLWQLPYIPEGSALFEELAAVDGFVRRTDGSMYDVGVCYTPGYSGAVGCIDFTNARAREVHQRWLRRLHELGASVIKVDFGEQAPLDGVYADGTPGHRAHNLYPLLYNESVAAATKDATGADIIWARSAWAGCQRFPLHWGGDSSATWHGLGPQLEAGLSFGLSGFSFWSQDIGGFLGHTGGDLLVRWMQAGLLLSHARIHGMGTREIDRFEPDVVDACRSMLELRYRLLPYLWGSAATSAARSLPMARALVVEFQDDPTTWHIGDQWLLGDALLVAPVLTPDGRRRAYLPPGAWTDWWTGAVVEGPRWLELEVPLDGVPMWIRQGHVVPLGPVQQHVDQLRIDELEVRAGVLRPGTTASFTVDLGDRVETVSRSG